MFEHLQVPTCSDHLGTPSLQRPKTIIGFLKQVGVQDTALYWLS